MEWNNFNASNYEYPEQVVEQMTKGFTSVTNNLCELHVRPRTSSIVPKLHTDFEFELVLTSRKLKNYQFVIFFFGYDVDLFPVSILLDSEIRKELSDKKWLMNTSFKVYDQEGLEKIVEKSFNTKRFKDVVGGLMKISLKY